MADEACSENVDETTDPSMDSVNVLPEEDEEGNHD